MATDLDQKAVANFRKYLQIPSVQPNINYDACVEFLKDVAKELELSCKVYEPCPKKPVIIMTWFGKDPKLPSILLNSHMDVVPVSEEMWTKKPFQADVIDGKIYARGTQDMKSVGIQYLEAIRRLKKQGVSLKRTVHVCFVPDEEIGGIEGMCKFVETGSFKNLNVGFAMDEGMTSESSEFVLFYAERYAWKALFHCTGKSGHGAAMFTNTSGEKAAHVMKRIYEFRSKEVEKVETTGCFVANVTSINVTTLRGGIHGNVIPAEFTIGIDVRIPPEVDAEQLEGEMKQWCKEAGEGVWMEFEQKEPKTSVTKLDDSNHYWQSLKQAFKELCIDVVPVVCPGGTDIRYVREKGIPALGFSPINDTPRLLHGHDEYLSVETFLKGIEIYCKIITSVANT